MNSSVTETSVITILEPLMYLSLSLLMKRLVRPCNADPEVPPAIIWLDGKFALET
jgi:hypothetical protein